MFAKKDLNNLKKETDNKLKKRVIDSLLDVGTEEEIESYINDLMNHGCVSGMVGELIYYSDTIKFYEKYKYEINDLLKETLDQCGYKHPAELLRDWDEEDSLALEQSNQNLLAWFGYEETARQIAYELGMEI
jgi:hypothetical protein